jgi:hypothetical protein
VLKSSIVKDSLNVFWQFGQLMTMLFVRGTGTLLLLGLTALTLADWPPLTLLKLDPRAIMLKTEGTARQTYSKRNKIQ